MSIINRYNTLFEPFTKEDKFPALLLIVRVKRFKKKFWSVPNLKKKKENI